MKELQENQTSSGNSAATCEYVEDRVHELMDHRQPLLSDEMVRGHISQCDRCAQLVVDFGALNESVSQIPLATLHRLSGIQEAELVQDQEPSRQAHPVLFVASIACLLLVMLTSGVWFSAGPADVSVEADAVAVVESSPQIENPSQFESSQIESVEAATVPPVPAVATVERDPEVQEAFVPAAMQQFGFVTHKTSSPADMIGAVRFEDLSDNVEPYQEYIGMTADLPGIQPVSKSVNATFHLIKTFSNQLQPAL